MQSWMRTAHLDEIVRQRDPDLKHAVELLAKGNTDDAVERLTEQQRVHEIPDTDQRLKTVAGEYLKDPDNSLVVSPDNQSRRAINRHIHESLQGQGGIASQDHTLTILVNRHELTGADPGVGGSIRSGGCVTRYTRGSNRIGVKEGEYATVVRIDDRQNLLTVRREDGKEVTYDPERLQGVNVYHREERQFSQNEQSSSRRRSRSQNSANRELGHIEKIDSGGNLRLRLESGKTIDFNLREHPHLDYGCAMTSYTSQGQTVDRVIVHVPAKDQSNSELVNQRFAYVALSRARIDAQVFTNDASTLAERLGKDVSKTAAVKQEHVRQTGQSAPERDAPTRAGAGTGMNGFELILPF